MNPVDRHGQSPSNWLTRWWPWLAASGTGAAVSVVLLFLGHPGAARTTMVVLSTILAASSAVPAVRETVRDRASLQPVTWGIWAILTATAAVASASDADYPATVFAAVGTATCATVAAVAARHGRWKPTGLDAACAVLAIAGIIIWQHLHQSGPAVAAACIGDFLGLLPTLRGVWVQPREVPTSVFTLIAAGGVCTVAASWGIWTISAVVYPLYVAVSTGAVALLSLRPATSGISNDRAVPARPPETAAVVHE